MKVWTCVGFKGHYPVGTALVVVAPTMEIAERLVTQELEKQGLPQEEGDVQLQELNTSVAQVRVLANGNY